MALAKGGLFLEGVRPPGFSRDEHFYPEVMAELASEAPLSFDLRFRSKEGVGSWCGCARLELRDNATPA
jgi:hypothetical protein